MGCPLRTGRSAGRICLTPSPFPNRPRGLNRPPGPSQIFRHGRSPARAQHQHGIPPAHHGCDAVGHRARQAAGARACPRRRSVGGGPEGHRGRLQARRRGRPRHSRSRKRSSGRASGGKLAEGDTGAAVHPGVDRRARSISRRRHLRLCGHIAAVRHGHGRQPAGGREGFRAIPQLQGSEPRPTGNHPRLRGDNAPVSAP